MNAESPQPRHVGPAVYAFAATAFHAALVLGLLVYMVAYVPVAKRTFDEFGLTLSWSAQSVIRASDWLADYWWLLALPMPLVLAADFAALLLLGGRPGRRWMRFGWMAGGAAVLAAAIVVAVLPVLCTLTKLSDGLSR